PPVSVVGFDGPVVQANAIQFIDYSFAPARVTVKAGTKVSFTNNGGEMHNASSSDGGGWDTGLLARGQSAAITFNRPGTYNFMRLRMTNQYKRPLPELLPGIIEAAEMLMDSKCDIIVFQCTGTSMSGGIDMDNLVVSKIAKATKRPAISTASAVKAAFAALTA